MANTHRKFTVKTLSMAGAALLSCAVALPSSAAKAATEHYYLELGGTGGALPAPQCTSSYDAANATLGGGIPVPVCYPASAGPFVEGVTAPNYDTSVHEGYVNLLKAAEDTHHAHPDARITITGYSQGAQAADDVLQTIANGTDIPASQVDGMLYADPQQPGTGFESVVPKGVSAAGFTSAGPGPVNFPGIPVARYCIHTDGVCDATSAESVGGYLAQHPRYPAAGNIIPQTLAHDGGNGVFWYPTQS